MRDLNLAELS
uniref:Uncharacterized protein n=1 Tax=Arundo donax TaxID=35708 RepID=A0A0A9I203_ARUDO